MEGVVKRRGARLPHWTLDGAAYFITFRTFDSLPRQVTKQLKLEIENAEQALKRKVGRDLTVREISDIRWKQAGRAEKLLDQGLGECLLARPGVAELVRDTLHYFDGQRFDLYAWCVMPNHVHALIRPYANHEPSGIVLSWKTWSARHANEHLNREGRFWQREYFDRIVRSRFSFEGTVAYILNNPSKAGLGGWCHRGSRPARLDDIVFRSTSDG